VVSNALLLMFFMFYSFKGVWPGMLAYTKTTFLVAGSALVTIGGAGWGAYLLGGMVADWLRGRNAKKIDRAAHPRAGKVVGMVVAGAVVTALALWVDYLFMGAYGASR
jgi:hypothetical protein